MLAEAAAKAAEHVALLSIIQQQSQQHVQEDQWTCKASSLPWYKPLAAARGTTGEAFAWDECAVGIHKSVTCQLAGQPFLHASHMLLYRQGHLLWLVCGTASEKGATQLLHRLPELVQHLFLLNPAGAAAAGLDAAALLSGSQHVLQLLSDTATACQAALARAAAAAEPQGLIQAYARWVFESVNSQNSQTVKSKNSQKTGYQSKPSPQCQFAVCSALQIKVELNFQLKI